MKFCGFLLKYIRPEPSYDSELFFLDPLLEPMGLNSFQRQLFYLPTDSSQTFRDFCTSSSGSELEPMGLNGFSTATFLFTNQFVPNS